MKKKTMTDDVRILHPFTSPPPTSCLRSWHLTPTTIPTTNRHTPSSKSSPSACKVPGTTSTLSPISPQQRHPPRLVLQACLLCCAWRPLSLSHTHMHERESIRRRLFRVRVWEVSADATFTLVLCYRGESLVSEKHRRFIPSLAAIFFLPASLVERGLALHFSSFRRYLGLPFTCIFNHPYPQFTD